ncbi:unnamed protein product, partial [Didymodactylos carnosus]
MPTVTNGSVAVQPSSPKTTSYIDDTARNGDDTFDPDNPAYRRDLERPPDVKEDMRQMGQRQRVTMILNSKEFRDELESIITDQLKHGPHPASLIALQQISELILPHTSRWTTVSSLSR